MPIKRKKISELTLSDNLKGLYTIGVKLINGVQTSVKVSLEYIQTAYDNVVDATKKAKTATDNANKAASTANTQAGRAKQQADNPPKMGENGNWWKWDEDSKKYVDTGVLAKGGVLYPTFTIDENDMILYMEFEDEISDRLIKFDEDTGELYLNVG